MPLHFAAHLGYIEILNKLLIVDKSATYKADNEGKTALHVAAGLGIVGIMRELISTYPGCCELVDKRGRNVLHFALESKNQRAVKLVLENSWLRNLINEKDENGNTPFLHAASMSYYDLSDPRADIKVFNHYRVDMQVFNHNNHNAADIISANEPISDEWLPDVFLWVLENYKVKRGLQMIVSKNDDIGEQKDEGNTVKSKSKEDGGAEDEGFTVPRGFVADKGPDQGATILTRNTAFRAFVILNTISMFLSCLAVFNHLAVSPATHVPDTRVIFKQMRLRQLLIGYAMWAMIRAFLLGTCAVLHNNRNLAISACVVPVAMYAFIELVTYKADNEGKIALHVAAGLGRVNVMQELMSTCPSCCEMVDKRGWNVLPFALESTNRKAIKLILENPWLGNLINEKDENGNTPFLQATSINYIVCERWSLKMTTLIDEGNTVKSKSNEDGDEDEAGFTVHMGFVVDVLIILTRKVGKSRGSPGDAGIGVVLRDNSGKVWGMFFAYVGLHDSNTAEVLAIHRAVSLCAESPMCCGKEIDIVSDSKVAVPLAIFNHISESSNTHALDAKELFKQMRFSLLLIGYAVMAMIEAFLSGTCAVLHSDKNLAISACVIPVAMFA
ncbi:hypothetical protein EZV62_002867 [Acer yangbiense]|uniref:PGG domain-containing protein n=1 Tax=Acer yangbiense TaxID=1000413 RepID=A0A5C7IYT3_9ROSI|nr:hypothetical protein EZV62_002867 [Acer yangbiense]